MILFNPHWFFGLIPINISLSAQPTASENQEAQQYGVNGYVQEDSLLWRERGMD